MLCFYFVVRFIVFCAMSVWGMETEKKWDSEENGNTSRKKEIIDEYKWHKWVYRVAQGMFIVDV